MAMEGHVSRVSAITKSEAINRDEVKTVVTEYKKLFDENQGGSVQVRQEKYMSMVNDFYNMVTDIYEFGWGESFHFAPRHKWESFSASIARHEMYLAHKLELQPGLTAIDLGCGVGGPGRAMARFSKANIVGLNNNEYQIKRCKDLTQNQGLGHLLSYMRADWQKIPVEDNTFDRAFHVEAMEHSPERVSTFSEVFRILKPGGLFAGYDWIITDKCDLNNPEHVRIKKEIELGNGLPDLQRPEEILDALKKAGFEILETEDVALCNSSYEIPWYDSLEGKYWSLANFKHTPLGRYFTNKFVWLLETAHLAPKGTLDVHNLLIRVATELVNGGQKGIFSPCYFYLCRKPLK